jgi:regulatory protein
MLAAKITKITPAVKTAGRYNVFVDGEFSFSLDEAQLVKLGLKKGEEISAEGLTQLKAESAFGKNYVRAVDLISRRLRSEKEIRDYARRKLWSEDNTERVIRRLYQRGYLDDEKFAMSFLNTLTNLHNYSVRRLGLELRKKGIKPEIIEKVISQMDDFDEQTALKQLIAKKRCHYANDERKLMAYLTRQGFSYDDVKKALDDTL